MNNNIQYLFIRLPFDLQNYIKHFIPVWERYGIRNPLIISNSNHRNYYENIRRKPKQICHYRPDIFEFYFRKPKYKFYWKLYLDYRLPKYDYWNIEMQSLSSYAENEILEFLFNSKYYDDIYIPKSFKRNSVRIRHSWNDDCLQKSIKFEFQVYRQHSIPTRQYCVDVLCDYMTKLGEYTEKIFTKCLF